MTTLLFLDFTPNVTAGKFWYDSVDDVDTKENRNKKKRVGLTNPPAFPPLVAQALLVEEKPRVDGLFVLVVHDCPCHCTMVCFQERMFGGIHFERWLGRSCG